MMNENVRMEPSLSTVEINSGEHRCLHNYKHFLTLVVNSSHLLKDFKTDPCWYHLPFNSTHFLKISLVLPQGKKIPQPQTNNGSPSKQKLLPQRKNPIHLFNDFFSRLPSYQHPALCRYFHGSFTNYFRRQKRKYHDRRKLQCLQEEGRAWFLFEIRPHMSRPISFICRVQRPETVEFLKK